MTITRVGSNSQYASGWEKAFGKGAKAAATASPKAKAAKKSPAKSSEGPAPAKKTATKSAAKPKAAKKPAKKAKK